MATLTPDAAIDLSLLASSAIDFYVLTCVFGQKRIKSSKAGPAIISSLVIDFNIRQIFLEIKMNCIQENNIVSLNFIGCGFYQ